jgi:hypothetical protein
MTWVIVVVVWTLVALGLALLAGAFIRSGAQ